MTWGGWIVLGLSVGSVTALFVWCIFKILTTPEETQKIHGFEGNPPDKESG